MIKLKRAVKSFVNEYKKETSHLKGESFEDEFEKQLFKQGNISILEKSHHKNQRGFIESNLNPDFKLKFKDSDFVFWVECKFRSSSINKNKIDIKNPKQYNRYKKLKEPVFYLINFDNEIISLLHIDNIYPEIYVSHLYKNEVRLPITEDYLKQLYGN